jgi:hypothetical protein
MNPTRKSKTRRFEWWLCQPTIHGKKKKKSLAVSIKPIFKNTPICPLVWRSMNDEDSKKENQQQMPRVTP